MTKHQDINQREVTKIRTRRHRFNKIHRNTCKIKKLGNIINYTYNNKNENIALYCNLERRFRINALKRDYISTLIYANAMFYTLDDIIEHTASEIIWNQIPESKKCNEFKQKNTRLSDMVN